MRRLVVSLLLVLLFTLIVAAGMPKRSSMVLDVKKPSITLGTPQPTITRPPDIPEAQAETIATEAAPPVVEEPPAPEPQRQQFNSGCCGPHSDAWWQGVAVCEQGGRNDPYFGYFSFMDGSQGGKPWEEQVAAGNALLARAGREVGPWAEACVRAGYNASPNG